MDHSHYDCFVLAVLTHGSVRNVLFGVDGNEFTLEMLMTPIKRCQTLAGKPKICIIQVNRLCGFFGSSSIIIIIIVSLFQKHNQDRKDSSNMWKYITCVPRVRIKG